MNRSNFMHRHHTHHDTSVWKAAFIAFALALLFSSRTAYGESPSEDSFRIGDVIRQERLNREADREEARKRVVREETERQIFVPPGPHANCTIPTEKTDRC
jgi:hypothetical protein